MFCHNAGNYTFTIYDNFCGSIPLLVIALFECLGVAYCYGLQRFSEDIELMTGTRPGLFLCLCWKYVSPAIMTAILVSFFTKMIFGDLSYEVYIRLMKMINEWFVPGLGRGHWKSCPEVLALVGLHHHRPPHWNVHPVDTLRGPAQVNQDHPK